jgi:ketosteroid isomerase-like protein
MKQTHMICFVFLFLFSSRSVFSQTDDAAAVREALINEGAAFERNDMAGVEKHWANDDSVVVFENGHANYGWSDYKNNHLGPEMAEMKNVSFKMDDIRVKTEGTLAYATFKYTLSADLQDQHVEGSGLGTAVLEKRGKDWMIVHWHSSSPRKLPVEKKPNQ